MGEGWGWGWIGSLLLDQQWFHLSLFASLAMCVSKARDENVVCLKSLLKKRTKFLWKEVTFEEHIK